MGCGGGDQADKISDNFFIHFLSSAYFTERVQLLLEKGVVKCIETLQVTKVMMCMYPYISVSEKVHGNWNSQNKNSEIQKVNPRKKFRDLLHEAKRTALDNYLHGVSGTMERAKDSSAQEDDLMKRLNEFETMLYARKLDLLLKP